MVKLKELEKWLTSIEAAERIGCSKPHVLKLARQKRLRGVQTHAGWLFDPVSVEKLAKEEEG